MMKIDRPRPTSQVGLFLLTLIALSPAHAQTRAQCEQQFQARSGQPGKDVMWVATIDELVTAMLRAAKVTNADRVIDLGSGDGKIAIAAAKQFGAQALGIEYNAGLVQLAECYARAEHLTHKVKFQQADIFATDFSTATVLALYLSPSINLKLRPTILNMRPGTRVVSNSFDMGDWQPDQLIESEVGNTRAFLWIVPAHVNGDWTFTETTGRSTFKVRLDQKFQILRNTPATAGTWTVRQGRMDGSTIELALLDDDGTVLTLKGRLANQRIDAQLARNGRIVRYVGVREGNGGE
jgi:SAM-dependent methyltransferase